MSRVNLPFKVGDSVEVRSFELGFRGAWFLCKITKIYKQDGALFYTLKYLDFPGEGLHKTKVFQSLEGGDTKYLMVRPVYPRKCRENEDLKEDGLEEALVVDNSWKVGDSVDWWKDYCYWSGKVLEVRENESLQIELWLPPYGEGDTYEVLSSDLRPSLDWSLDEGWIVPFSADGQNRRCAKLIKLLNEDKMEENVPENSEEEMQKSTQKVKSDVFETTIKQIERPTQKVKNDVSETAEVKDNASETTEVKGGASETTEEQMQRPVQKLKGDGDLLLNIMESESREAAILDLEELIVRVQWIKGMLAQDESKSSANSSWKYFDYRPSSSSM